jgi:uncharacterized metal-binding protein
MSARIAGIDGRAELAFTFVGRPCVGRDGDTIAMALWAAGEAVLRQSSKDAAPRGVLCNMGICYECLVVVDGVTVRACTTLLRAGMGIERGGKP